MGAMKVQDGPPMISYPLTHYFAQKSKFDNHPTIRLKFKKKKVDAF